MERSDLGALYGRCREGSREAWDELVRRLDADTRLHVRNIFNRFGLGSVVEDHLDQAVSYVFEELYIEDQAFSPDHFDLEFRLFRRKKIVRFMNREIAHYRRVRSLDDGLEGRVAASASGQDADPEDTYLRFMDMVKLLDRLPPKYGLVCKLRLLEDLSFADVAAVLGINESTARTRFNRGLDKIKKKLTKEFR